MLLRCHACATRDTRLAELRESTATDSHGLHTVVTRDR